MPPDETPQGQEPTQPDQEPDITTPTTPGETPPWGDDFNPEQAWNTIQNLRKFEKEVKTLRPIATEYKKLKDAELSETDRLKKQLEDYDTELNDLRTKDRERRAQDAVVTAAAGAINPKAIWRMVRADISYDTDGKPTNLDDLIAVTRADYPELFRSPNGSADGGAGAGGTPAGQDINSLIRQMASEAR